MTRTFYTRLLMGAFVVGFLSVGNIWGDEPIRSEIGRALSDLDVALQDDSSMNADTKSALLNLSDALRSGGGQGTVFPVTASVNDTSLVAASSEFNGGKDCGCGCGGKDWCAKEVKLPGNTCVLSFFGDFRLRHESRYNTPRQPGHNRHRERIRFRFGANFEISDQLLVGFRARTGNPDDPNSPHHTMSDAFDSLDFNLDRAFLRYTPYWAPNVALFGGKFANPFDVNPVYSELVWDADINPEGIALVWDGGGAVRAVVGAYIVDERHQGMPVSFEETTLITAQITGRKDLSDSSEVFGSVGYYYYSELNPNGSTTLVTGQEARGNLMVGAPELYASDFGIVDAFLAYKTHSGCVPIVFSAEYIKNDRAINNNDEGYAAGFAIGQTSNPGDRKVFYQYQDIEQEAVFAGFANDDFPYATNYSGHVIGGEQKLGKATVVRIWALNSERQILDASPTNRFPDSSRWTFRADLNVKF